jgi:hypothetical protein
MKMHTAAKRTIPCLIAVVLITMGTIPTVLAQTLQGSISTRALTPQDIKDYGLTGKQGASGMATVGVGQPVYLDALINISIKASNITSVTWALTNRPATSIAVVTNSPLGTNVPTFKPADKTAFQVAGRAVVVPDVTGQYTVVATIVTAGSGSTNVVQNITAGTYLGIEVCSFCHSGGVGAEDKYHPWIGTLHSHAFKDAINGVSTDHFSKNCTACHVVGYDTNALAVNGGFDDVAKQYGWIFPTNLSSTNWDAMPSALQNVANIQCESCHGPGSEHAYAFGNTNLFNWPRLTTTYAPGSCAQCHDSLDHHYKTAEWKNSRHAVATRTPSGPTRINCVRCHTAPGFKQFIEHAGDTNTYATNTVYEAITCAACHDPHDASNPHQLRSANIYTLPEGTTVTNVGLGGLCMECHHSRNGSASNNIANYQLGKPTWAGGSSFGVHDSTAGDVVEGVNAITYGKVIPSGAHSYSVSNVCVGCHMQSVVSTDPAFTKAGGHTFSMNYTVVTNNVTNVVDKVDVCVKCHGPITEFNMVRKDYNGDGVIEGIQTEVEHLLDRLSTMLPGTNYVANGNYVADGKVKTSLSVKTNWPVKFLNAAWNWQLVDVEGSHGIHNAPFVIGVLKASIADLTGDANEDGIADSWQAQYFGDDWVNNTNSAPNACPAGDGIPNWLKYTLGLNPWIPGAALPDGVVWVNDSQIGGGTNTIRIYTAAEVNFDTEVGKTYQIQAVSNLGDGWQNVGTNIPGTGSTISYLTPMRNNVQQYFRVMHNP